VNMKTSVQSRMASDQHPHSAFRTPHSQAGFTLLEVLVATGVLALMVTILFALFNEGSNAWRMGEKTAEVNQGVRTAMELIVREASLAVVDISTNMQLQGLSVVMQKNSTGERPASSPSPYGVYEELCFAAPVELGNETTNTAINAIGYRALCGVRYYVAQVPAVGGERPSVLGNLIRVVYYTSSKSQTTPDLYKSSWWQGGIPAGTMTNSAVLAENVLTFRVQPAQFTKGDAQGVRPYTDTLLFADMNSDLPYFQINSGNFSGKSPSCPGIYVGLCVVDSRLASRINHLGLDGASKTVGFQTTTNWTLVHFENYYAPYP